MWNFLKTLPIGVGLPIMIMLVSVSPEAAGSNFSAWLQFFGFHHIPGWLRGPSADELVLIGTVVASAIYAAIVWRRSLGRLFASRVGLYEAAVEALEKTKDTEAAIMASAMAEGPNDVITWYCRSLTQRDGGSPLASLYGSQPPSTAIEPIDPSLLSRYDFEVVGKTVILKERHGHMSFENLSVRRADLARAVKVIGDWGK